jgi:hypothetical protein
VLVADHLQQLPKVGDAAIERARLVVAAVAPRARDAVLHLLRMRSPVFGLMFAGQGRKDRPFEALVRLPACQPDKKLSSTPA